MKCPFEVGDRIINKSWSFEPVATVVSITKLGFTYKYDEPYYVHPRLGITVIEGEIYEAAFEHFEKVDKDYKQPEITYTLTTT